MVDKDKLRSYPSLRVWDQIQDTTSVWAYRTLSCDFISQVKKISHFEMNGYKVL